MSTKALLKDIASFSKGEQINGEDLIESGVYPYLNGGIQPSGRWSDYNVPGKTITISEGGNSCGYVNLMPEPFWCGAHCYYLYDVKIDVQYLYFALKSQQSRLMAIRSGACMPNIKKNSLGCFELTIHLDKAEQQHIANQLLICQAIIKQRRLQLLAFDTLIKARFVEMFGDPLFGTDKWPIQNVGDVADSVDPQPSHRTPPVDESGIPYVSIKDCDYKTGKIDFKKARKVGRNVLAEHLQRYELHDGDFIIGKIGTIGNPIFVPARKDYTLSANIVLIQPDKKKVSPYFLKYSFMSAYMDRQFEEAKNSTSQAAFGIQKVRAIKVMNPPIDIQYQFETFAKQVDKSKVIVQQALEKAQMLFDSLMQQYFG